MQILNLKHILNECFLAIFGTFGLNLPKIGTRPTAKNKLNMRVPKKERI
jgi:hypothetical protein